jgi:phage tail-like protein
MSRLPIIPRKPALTQHKYQLFSNNKQVAEFKTLKTTANTGKRQKIVLGQVKVTDATFGSWIKCAATKSAGKNLVIHELDALGKLLSVYRVSIDWVSEFQLVPELDAGGNSVSMEFVTIETEGWQRDDNPP